jgi:hypothetical protein
VLGEKAGIVAADEVGTNSHSMTLKCKYSRPHRAAVLVYNIGSLISSGPGLHFFCVAE